MEVLQLSKLKSAGENGDVEAQYASGLMYLYGEILDVDYEQARIWMPFNWGAFH